MSMRVALRCLFSLIAMASMGALAADSRLETNFRNPPTDTRPWVYWWWHNGNMTEASITRDLEEMKAKGIGGVLMFDSRGYHQQYLPPPPDKNQFLDPEWRHLVKFAIQEVNRLGMRMSMNLSMHAGSLHAPWNMGESRPKKLVWTSCAVTGGRKFTAELKKGEGDALAHDVALFAVRSEAAPKEAGDGLNGKWRDIQTTAPTGAAAGEVIDLTSHADANGRVSWDAPAGEWTVLRFAYIIMPGFDLTVDVLNKQAVDSYFQRVAGPILADAGPLAGKALTHFYSVSWEGAAPTWTPGFEAEFQHYRGYNVISNLPVLAGVTVKDRAQSERFLADFIRTLSDCFLNNCYGELRTLTNRAGMQWHAESGGPWGKDLFFQQADQLEYWARNDMPQGEFWQPEKVDLPVGSTRANLRRTAMAGHIYGLPIIASESFTHMISHWIMYPARLKPNVDDVFIDGANQIIWHTFSASPKEFGKPGIIYWAGTHLNPNVTWWEQSSGFLDYLARCQYLLRQGLPVNDVLVYASSHNNSVWGHDEKWNSSPTLTLGQGYKHDVISREALLARVSVKDGKLALPDGMSYRMLVVDPDEDVISPEVLAKIDALASAGVRVVVGRKQPAVAFGLRDYPSSDERVHALAAKLWSGANGVVTGVEKVDDVLQKDGIAPDFEGPFHYTHRHADGADIYFLVGEGRGDCTFRVTGREPELWNAVTGELRQADSWRTTRDGRITVTLTLPKHGSMFVVFRKPTTAKEHMLMRAAVVKEPLPLTGAWDVSFTPGWGAPAKATFEQLTPWDENAVEGIKHFSGTATYRKTFELTGAQACGPLQLSLGEVCNIASVRLNGKPLGIVWTAPWTVSLAGAARAGRNELEIDVTNTWVNRLIGDAALPENERFTKTHARREPGVKYPMPRLHGYLATDSLMRSGLLGPVEITF